MAPLIASRLDVLTDDESAYREASERAARVAADLTERGIAASGERSVEDPFDTAVTRLDTGEYDGVVVAVTGEGHWREEGLLERLRDATDLPITEVVIEE